MRLFGHGVKLLGYNPDVAGRRLPLAVYRGIQRSDLRAEAGKMRPDLVLLCFRPLLPAQAEHQDEKPDAVEDATDNVDNVHVSRFTSLLM